MPAATLLEAARKTGLTSINSLSVLLMLADEPRGLTLGEIAGALGTSHSNVTNLIDHLARLGLAERRHDEEDRRKIYALLTEAGHQAARRIDPSIQDEPAVA